MSDNHAGRGDAREDGGVRGVDRRRVVFVVDAVSREAVAFVVAVGGVPDPYGSRAATEGPGFVETETSVSVETETSVSVPMTPEFAELRPGDRLRLVLDAETDEGA